ncbi:MAG: flippase-like domain-containing protein [Candidatus Hydrothermarchaeales archaeon]
MDSKYKKSIALLFVLGALIFTILIKLIGIDDAIKTLKLADKRLFLLAVLLQFIIIGIRSFRWQFLLKDVGENVGLKDLYVIILAGTFGNNITPGARVGGEPLKAYLLKKNFGIRVRKGFATVVAERVYDFMVLAVMALISYLYVMSMLEIERRSKLVITVLMIVLILFLSGVANAIFSPRLAGKILHFLPERYKTGFLDAFSSFRENSLNLIKNMRVFLPMFLLTAFLWLLDVLRVVILFYSLSYPAPFMEITMIFTLSVFLSTLPFLPGGLGLTEGVMIGLYSAVGIPFVITVIVTLLDRLISYWLMIFMGGIAAVVTHIQEIDIEKISVDE